MYRTLAFLRAALTTFMAVVCIVGDWLVERNSNSSITKAILDNVTHACVGLLTGLLLFVQVERRISSAEKYAAIIVCCLVSSLIDIDHFIAARSWKLKVCIEFSQINVAVSYHNHIIALFYSPECHESTTTATSSLYHNPIADSSRQFFI